MTLFDGDRTMRVAIALLLLLQLLNSSFAPTVATGFQERKVAFLVGVEQYDKRGFTNLSYSEDDMQALRAALEDQGFSVTLMLGSDEGETRATGENVRRAFEEQFVPVCKSLNKADIALVALAGHGRHKKTVQGSSVTEDHYFCPADAHDNDETTWISISNIVAQLEAESGSETNLILVDACRDNPSRGRGVDGKGFSLNRDAVAILFASSYSEQAYEPDDYGHGLFTYFLLKGLSGEARDFEGNVTWDSMVGYVKTNVSRTSRELMDAGTIAGLQRPNQVGNLRGASPVLASGFSVRPGGFRGLAAPFSRSDAETAQQTLAESLDGMDVVNRNSLGMNMVLIPPGEFMMGSVESEQRVVNMFPRESPDLFRNEHPVHPVRITKPFLISSCEVTQDQFRQFVSETGHKSSAETAEDSSSPLPVAYEPGTTWNEPGNHSPSGNCPVCIVSWNDAKAFCEWLSEKEGKTYRLPTQAEWEYCCRAGTESMYWTGNSPNSLASGANVPDISLTGRLNYDLIGFQYYIGANDWFDGGWITELRTQAGLKYTFGTTFEEGRSLFRITGIEGDKQLMRKGDVEIYNESSNSTLELKGLDGRRVTVQPGQRSTIKPLSAVDFGALMFSYPGRDDNGNPVKWDGYVMPGWVLELDEVEGAWGYRLSIDSRTDRAKTGATFRNLSESETLEIGWFGEKQAEIPPGQEREINNLPSARYAFDRIDASDGFADLAPVGSFRPNAFGLYDIIGNVWEWCEDGYDPDSPYPDRLEIDPVGPAGATQRVIRGGCLW